METQLSVLITGAAGNLGTKLSRHLDGRFALRLLIKTE
jgi:nucleoside-diphosphate-sugar epimerase